MMSFNTERWICKENQRCISSIKVVNRHYIKESGMIEIGKQRSWIRRLGKNRNVGLMELSTYQRYHALLYSKTPGTIIIRTTGNNNIIEMVDRSLTHNLRLSYKLSLLQFGLGNNTFDFPIAHKSPVVEAYIKELQGNIASRSLVQDFSQNKQRVNYYNHLKIIPVVFDQKSSLIQTGQKYRYSLRAGQHLSYQPHQQIFFYTQIQPINIVYKKEGASLYNLIINILAIVGGTVATIGIVNSISHFLFNIK